MRPRMQFQEDQFSTPINIDLDTTSEPTQPIMLIWQGDEYAAVCVDLINFPDFLGVLQFAYDEFLKNTSATP